MKPGDRVRMLDGVHQGELMYVMRECDGGGLWEVAPFPDGRGGIYVRPHQVEVVPTVEVDYAKLELRLVAQMSGEGTDIHKRLAEAIDRDMVMAVAGEDIHQRTADELGITRAEAKVWNFKRLYGGGDN